MDFFQNFHRLRSITNYKMLDFSHKFLFANFRPHISILIFPSSYFYFTLFFFENLGSLLARLLILERLSSSPDRADQSAFAEQQLGRSGFEILIIDHPNCRNLFGGNEGHCQHIPRPAIHIHGHQEIVNFAKIYSIINRFQTDNNERDCSFLRRLPIFELKFFKNFRPTKMDSLSRIISQFFKF